MSPSLTLDPASDRLRILYVEDLPELRRIVARILELDEHTVITAPNGADAHHLLAAAPDAFDLVITDHCMPVMNGLDLVACLRALRFRGKVVVLSCVSDPEVRAAYRGFHVDALLDKPVTADELRATLHRLFAPVEVDLFRVPLPRAHTSSPFN
ncbi:MAG: response regulator [Candidatus Didemnitutus sp.]|nr:response regulator [Candidatus Didemnitutus sp.]